MGRSAKKKKVFAEINITPLTDVFLVLLVVVIIAAPALNTIHGDIATPEISAAAVLDKSLFVVEVDRAGVIFIDGAPVAEAELAGVLVSRAASLEEKKIIIRGDQTSKSGAILEILRVAQESGFEQGFILGQAPSLVDGANQ